MVNKLSLVKRTSGCCTWKDELEPGPILCKVPPDWLADFLVVATEEVLTTEVALSIGLE